MHAQRGPTFGRVGHVDGGGVAAGGSCEAIVLDRALADLAEGAARDGRLEAVRDDLQERLRGLAAAIHPRSDHRLIHGELGPDHVLVDARGRPVMIDIEGLMYFDVEWEHVFLRLLDGDFPERAGMLGIVEYNLRRVLDWPTES
jgi:hypothetical protein